MARPRLLGRIDDIMTHNIVTQKGTDSVDGLKFYRSAIDTNLYHGRIEAIQIPSSITVVDGDITYSLDNESTYKNIVNSNYDNFNLTNKNLANEFIRLIYDENYNSGVWVVESLAPDDLSLTEITVVNDDIAGVPLTIDAITGTTSNLQEWNINGSTLSYINNLGQVYAGIFYDINDSSYYLNPANSTTSLKVAGDIDTLGDLKLGTSSNIISTGNSSFLIQSNENIILDIDSNNNSDTALFKITQHDQASTLFTINDNGDLTITGDINIAGDILQDGGVYETHTELLYTENDFIFLRDGAISGLSAGDYTGLISKLADGTSDSGLIFDGNGIARIGDIDLGSGTPYIDTQAIATREDTPGTNAVPYWNSTNIKFESTEMYWDEGNTRLGIGNNSPDYTLTVEGDIKIDTKVQGTNYSMEYDSTSKSIKFKFV